MISCRDIALELGIVWKLQGVIDWLERQEQLLVSRTILARKLTTTTYVLIGLFGALVVAMKFGWVLGTLWYTKKLNQAINRPLTSSEPKETDKHV